MLSLPAAGLVAALSIASLVGPPHITVRAITTPAGVTSFELDVEHHTRPEDLTVTGRAEGVRDGRRVSVPLTITHRATGKFSVSRQWDASTPWVLVFSAEQGPNGTHGVVEAVVSLDAKGTVKSIEYTTPGFVNGTGVPTRLPREKVDAALVSLGVRLPQPAAATR